MTVLILGSDGFVGRNLLEDLSRSFDCFGSTRKEERFSNGKNLIFFDLQDDTTWRNAAAIQPDCIINCIVSRAVKSAEDVEQALDINYIQTTNFYTYLSKYLPEIFLIHFGTTFEYDHSEAGLTEESRCWPKTYYGISKFLVSHYLLNNSISNKFTIIRPFNLFGPYDKEEKIIPYLICAQRDKKFVSLTAGHQNRDYFFVKDLSVIVEYLLLHPSQRKKIINAGSGQPLALKEIANIVAKSFPSYDPSLWQWGKLSYGQGEESSFFNASTQLKEKRLVFTEFEQAIQITVAYYCNLKKINPYVSHH